MDQMTDTASKSPRSVTGCYLTPTMHPDYAIGTRVEAVLGTDGLVRGTITGVAAMHIMFHYIITLDAPLTAPGHERWTTVSVSGCQLTPLE